MLATSQLAYGQSAADYFKEVPDLKNLLFPVKFAFQILLSIFQSLTRTCPSFFE